MSQQADAQRLPPASTSGAFEVPEMEPSSEAPPPPPAFVEAPLDGGDSGRAKRRRAWLIIGAAVIIPAGAAAALVAIFAGGSSPAVPAETAAVEPVATTAQPSVTLPNAQRPEQVRAAAPAADAESAAAPAADAAREAAERAAAQPAAAETAAPPEPAPILTPAEQLASWQNTTVVEVQEGDTLWGYALQYGTSVEAIEMLNAITAQTLEIGYRLTIPIGFTLDLANTGAESGDAATAWRASTTTEAAAAPGTPLSQWPNITQVEIVYGNTLQGIASEFGTSIEAIMVLSHISNPHEIYPGDILTVPIGYSAEVSSVTVPEWTAPEPEAATAPVASSAITAEPATAVETTETPAPAVTLPPAAAETSDDLLSLPPAAEEPVASAQPSAAATAPADDELMFEEDAPAVVAEGDDLMFLEDEEEDDLLLLE